MTEAAFLTAVAAALGRAAKSPPNPDGGEGFFVEGETRPWVVLCGEPYEFKTPLEAIAKARELAAME